MASGLDNSSLMKRQGTKTAATIAATIADQTEFHLFDCRNTTCFFIGRMIGSHIRKCIYGIHLTGSQWFGWRILHDIAFIWIRLNEPLCCKWIRIAILCIKTVGIGFLAGTDFFVRWQCNTIVYTVRILCLVYCAVDISKIFDINATAQPLCHSHDTAFSHSI